MTVSNINSNISGNERQHNIVIENRGKLIISGVDDVESFEEDDNVILYYHVIYLREVIYVHDDILFLTELT